MKNTRSKFSSRPTLRATSAPTTPLTAQTRATEPMPSLHHRTRGSLCSPGTLPAPLHNERVAGGALAGAAAILRLVTPAPATPLQRTAIWTSWDPAIPPSPGLDRTCVSSAHPGAVPGPAGNAAETVETGCHEIADVAVLARNSQSVLVSTYPRKNRFHAIPLPSDHSYVQYVHNGWSWRPGRADSAPDHLYLGVVDNGTATRSS